MTHDPSNHPVEVVKGSIFETPMYFVSARINADMARDLLMHNKKPKKDQKATNRNQSDRLIKKYAQQMITGLWEHSPQPIIFSEFQEGFTVSQLNDGQHRLEAVIMADKAAPGIEVPFTFCFDAPVTAMMVVDLGKMRVPADWLAMMGEANSQNLAKAVKMLYAVEKMQPFKSITLWRAIQMPPNVQKEFLAEHPDLRYSLDEALKAKSQVIPYVGAVLYYMMNREYGLWKTQEFFTGLVSGANLPIDDPRLKVREFMSIQKAAKHKWDGFEQLGLLISAVNAWLLGIETFKAKGAFTKLSTKFPELTAADKLPQTILTPGNS